MKKKGKGQKLAAYVPALALAFALTGCALPAQEQGKQEEKPQEWTALSVPGFEQEQQIEILLAEDGISVSGRDAQTDGAVAARGVETDGARVTITRGGCYIIRGELVDGQIRVDAQDDESVILVLAGVSITNVGEAALRVKNAELTVLFLEEGTENLICSGPAEIIKGLEDDESFTKNVDKESVQDAEGGAIHAKDDLSVMGTGALRVIGGINNGIHTSNRLTITGGDMEIRAVNHGIKGKDSVTIEDGSFRIISGGDGIRSDDTTGEGYGEIAINGGSFFIRSQGNGLRARTVLSIAGGELEIAESSEGLEANQILISGGTLDITAEDDGINANGDPAYLADGGLSADSSGRYVPDPGKEGDGNKNEWEKFPNLVIRGGQILVDARGDGLDSNGNILIEGGVTIIDGPESDKDGPLDYGHENGGRCLISGGTVLAVGSSAMAETFGEESSQYSFRHIFEAPYPEGSEISVSDSEGRILLTHTARKEGASVVFGSPELTAGEIYRLRAGTQEVSVKIDKISTISGGEKAKR